MQTRAWTTRARAAGECAAPSTVAHSLDRVSVRNLIRGPQPAAKLAIGAPGDACEQEADCIAERVMRAPAEQDGEEEELVQAKPLASGSPLPAPARTFFESRFGVNFGAVRIHNDAGAAESARALHARAYTLGPDIAFAAGEYAPDQAEGRRLLAHELTHVIQQGAATEISSGREPEEHERQ